MNEMNGMNGMTMYAKGDRISYKDDLLGTVMRINILGLRPCCAIQGKWDDTTKMQSVLQMQQLQDVVKL